MLSDKYILFIVNPSTRSSTIGIFMPAEIDNNITITGRPGIYFDELFLYYFLNLFKLNVQFWILTDLKRKI